VTYHTMGRTCYWCVQICIMPELSIAWYAYMLLDSVSV